MLNNSGIVKTSGIAPNSILFNAEHFVSVGAIVNGGPIIPDEYGKKIVKAGTPVTGDLTSRSVALTKASVLPSVLGVFSLRILEAFAADETIVIEGVTYTCKAEENVGAKQFAGADAAAQITSLAKMVTAPEFVIVAGEETDADKLIFTQKVADKLNIPMVSTSATTGEIGPITTVVQPVEEASSNAVGILLHDIDVTLNTTANATVLIFGFVNLDRLDSATQALITPAVKAVLNAKVTFLKD